MTLSQYDSFQQVISSSPQDLLTPQTTNTRDEHIHDLSGNRTRDPRNRAATYLHLRPHGYREHTGLIQRCLWVLFSH